MTSPCRRSQPVNVASRRVPVGRGCGERVSGKEREEETTSYDDRDTTKRYVAIPNPPEIAVECFMLCEAVRIIDGQLFIFGGGLDVFDVYDDFPAKIPMRLAVRVRLPISFQTETLPCALIFARRLEEETFPGMPLIDELSRIDFDWVNETPPFRGPPSESKATFVAATYFSYDLANISEDGPYMILFRVHDEDVAMIPLVVVDRTSEPRSAVDVP